MVKFVPTVAYILCLALPAPGSFLTMFCIPFCASLYIATLAARRSLGIQNHPHISAVFTSMLSIPGMGLAWEQGLLVFPRQACTGARSRQPPFKAKVADPRTRQTDRGRCQIPRALRARPPALLLHTSESPVCLRVRQSVVAIHRRKQRGRHVAT